ncbi:MULTISPECIES: EAL domain-containing protein [Bacillus]|uniref:EAL domain-containing protein n=1 Tax=Bacillus TaxID=1386 RepID=UPI0002DD3714|nr:MULTISPECIES: EAL domain-containing protein [Bacillus]
MAKSLNYLYTDVESLKQFIVREELSEYPNLLVQIFSGIRDQKLLSTLLVNLKENLPLGVIIGCTANGELADGQMYEKEIVISFTIFENTEIKQRAYRSKDFLNSEELGNRLISHLGRNDAKVIFLLSAGLEQRLSQVMNGIVEHGHDIVITGGIASPIDNQKPMVFTENEMIEDGVVAAVLSNNDLIVSTYDDQKWASIGKMFSITCANKNIVYTINDKKPIHIFENYLGKYFTESIKNHSLEFPLIIVRNGKERIVYIHKLLSNGAVELSEKVFEGDSLAFAYVKLDESIQQSKKMMKKMLKTPIETIFIYQDLSKKHLLKSFAQEELRLLSNIANHSGFLSNNLFFNSISKDYPNAFKIASMISMSENTVVHERKVNTLRYNMTAEMRAFMVLSQLMKETTKEIKFLQKELVNSDQYFTSFFEYNTDFVYLADVKGKITRVNKSFMELTSDAQTNIMGRSVLDILKIEDISKARMYFRRAVKGKYQQYKIDIQSNSGEIQYFQIKNIPIIINNEVVAVYGIGRNISDQKRIEDQLVELSYYDAQTGLPNRSRFTELLKEHLSRSHKKKRELAVVFIDVDRFKMINDSLGHEAGDEILRELAKRIKNNAPLGTYVGRFAGDKFALIITKNVCVEQIQKIVTNIKSTLEKTLVYKNQEFYITSSSGVSMFPEDGTDSERLLKNADLAMNRAKSQGGNQIKFFCNEMNNEAIQRLELESSLRKAMHNQEFYLCYQPLVDLKSGEVYGSESLIRWQHPTKGLISPGEFIPLAEETGLIEEIGTWVLYTACRQNKEWQEQGLGDLVISVNVSAHQFQQPSFLEKVTNALNETGLEAKYLHLELTESVMISDLSYSISIIDELHLLGVKVSIDDFGTGYSSLSYLKSMPIDYLKIDRSFINNLKENTSEIAIVKAIIMMGYGLSMKVIAEGVETEEQIELLKEMDCHYAQGFYINKPLTIEAFERRLLDQKIVNEQ